jgi:hypothetical protein
LKENDPEINPGAAELSEKMENYVQMEKLENFVDNGKAS